MHRLFPTIRAPRHARAAAVTALGLTLAATGAAGGTAWAAPAHPASATQAASGHRSRPLQTPAVTGELWGVTAVSAKNVWAVGYGGVRSSSTTLAEQYNGTSWQVVPTPNPTGATESELAAVSHKKTSVWAVGYSTNGSTYSTLAEHYNGTSWQIIPTPNPSGATYSGLYAVSVVSATNVWAVGCYGSAPCVGLAVDGGNTLVEHWNGKKWDLVASPNPSGSGRSLLLGVSAVSAKNVWAVGFWDDESTASNDTLVEHYNGTKWKVVASPNLNDATDRLDTVARVSTRDVWAAGAGTASSGEAQALTEQWNGSSWQIVTSPTIAYSGLLGLASVSASDVWVVGCTGALVYGGDILFSEPPVNPIAEHWNGSRWKAVATPTPAGATKTILTGAASASAKNVWSVGSVSVSGVVQTVIEHWNGSKWTLSAS